MSDPFEALEHIERAEVIEWALSESRKCVESLKPLSEKIFAKAIKYYTLPLLYNVKKAEAGLFYMRRDLGYSVVMRRGEEEVGVVNSQTLGEGAVIHNYYVDRRGRFLAYFYALRGADVGELVVLDLGRMEVIDRLRGSISDVVILDDGSFYYSMFFRSGSCPDGVEAPCDRVFLRRDGRDELVFGEGLPRNYFVSLDVSGDGRKALVNVSYGWLSNTLYAGPIEDPGKWTKVLGGDFRARFVDSLEDGYLVVIYDRRGLGRIVRVLDGELLEVVPEQEAYLQDSILVSSYLVSSYLLDASSRIKIFDLKGRMIREVGFPEPANVISMRSYGNVGLLEVRYFTKPYEVLEAVPEGGGVTLRMVVEHPKVVDAEVSEGFAESHDGTRVHYFWLRSPRKAGVALIYGYGGFGIALAPNFLPWVPVLLELGVDVVVANLRGGSEYGEEWHKAGMRERKVNVFYDYIAVTEKFKSLGYRVAGMGRSNGGLLMGAVITMRPDLLSAAAIGYPVLDMLRFHRLYIGAAWIPEYGDPDNPSDREYLLRYSPYHNLKEGVRYPPTIIYTGLHDDRVHPAHALKFYAKLISYGNESCLRIETASGHAGSSPEVLAKEMAEVIAFLAKKLDLKIVEA